uniref:Uncharacterized protein n=1 Tax=Siphoviridae sp. ctXQq5 TaxID=2826368 RepID=A0A8S5N1P8_9CAUD|nr:MAG TPA: hypothetical protein [Siphoviridae sp. ctXQq5]
MYGIGGEAHRLLLLYKLFLYCFSCGSVVREDGRAFCMAVS